MTRLLFHVSNLLTYSGVNILPFILAGISLLQIDRIIKTARITKSTSQKACAARRVAHRFLKNLKQ